MSKCEILLRSDVTIPITRIINYSVILSECEESHKIEKSYKILRLKPQYDKMDWRFTPIH